MVQPLWKIVWQWHILTRWPNNLPLRETKIYVHTKAYPWMFIAVLFIIARSWKQHAWVVWMDMLWYICVMEYYTAGKELLITCSNLDEFEKHYAEWKKPVLEDYIILLYSNLVKIKLMMRNKHIIGCQEVWEFWRCWNCSVSWLWCWLHYRTIYQKSVLSFNVS